jgi:hypothetical protein
MRFRPLHIAKSVGGERLAVQFRSLEGVLRHRFIPYCPFSGRSNVLESMEIVYYIAQTSILHRHTSKEFHNVEGAVSPGICRALERTISKKEFEGTGEPMHDWWQEPVFP